MLFFVTMCGTPRSTSCLNLSACQPVRWLINLENTKWLQYISGLLKASLLVVNAIDKDRKSVLVHCSDGWDRTPQIVALAELLLDPYYRTVEVRLTALHLYSLLFVFCDLF